MALQQQREEQQSSVHLWKWLVCPKTRTRLVYDEERSELVSLAARLAYPVRFGVPILIVEEAREMDVSCLQEV